MYTGSLGHIASVNLLSNSATARTFLHLLSYSTASARHLNRFGSPFIFFCELSASFLRASLSPSPRSPRSHQRRSPSFRIARRLHHHQRHRSQMTSATAMAADGSDHPGVALQPVGPNELPASVSIRQEIAINAKPC